MDLNSIQKQVGVVWTDDKKQSVPRKYLSNEQVFDEANVFRAFSVAKKLQEHMLKQKEDLRKIVDKLISKHINDAPEADQKSFTFTNFDRSISIEAETVSSFDYDREKITDATKHFKSWLNDDVNNNVELKELVEDTVLNMQKQRLTVSVVQKIEKLGRKIDHPEIKAAVELIEQSKFEREAKTYYRIRVKNPETNNYELVDLNFSSI
jgi:hypothetical protein